jgi:hypothetical protein
MAITIHPHAKERMQERGATEKEVIKTVEQGEKFPVKFGKIGFRHNFLFEDTWRGKKYNTGRSICNTRKGGLGYNYSDD